MIPGSHPPSYPNLKLVAAHADGHALATWLAMTANSRPKRLWIVPVTGPILEGLGHLTLAEAQQAVSGYLELVPGVPWGRVKMFVNEEGRVHQLPANPVASAVARQLLVGTALITNTVTAIQ